LLTKRFKIDTLLKKAPTIKEATALGSIVFSSSIITALINPTLLYLESLGVYLTIDFNAYPLSYSTILNNRAALYLINNKELLVLGSFKKSA
jgi:hypothetical protein